LRKNPFTGVIALCLEAGEAEVSHVHCRAFHSGDLSFRGGEVELRHLRLEALWSDTVDRAGQRLVLIGVTADTRVIPVCDVDRTVGTDDDIGGAEQGLGLVAIDTATLEIGAGEVFLLIGRQEIEALHFESSTLRHRDVSEHGVACRLATKQ
jgi:hypothetical protein